MNRRIGLRFLRFFLHEGAICSQYERVFVDEGAIVLVDEGAICFLRPFMDAALDSGVPVSVSFLHHQSPSRDLLPLNSVALAEFMPWIGIHHLRGCPCKFQVTDPWRILEDGNMPL